MSGNNGCGCNRVCCSCLDNIRSFSSCIINFPFLQCFLTLILLTVVHFVRSFAIILSSVLVNLSWFLFEGTLSVVVFVYSIALILCVFLTFIKPQGSWNEKIENEAKGEKRRQKQSRQGAPAAQRQNQRRQGGPGARQHIECRQGGQRVRPPPIRHEPEVADQPPAESLSNTMEQRQAADTKPRHIIHTLADVHAEESRENCNYIEPTSTSSNEPIQQAALSDSGSNLPSSSADPSTKSTPMPLDDVATEELRNNDELLQQAESSDSESNLP